MKNMECLKCGHEFEGFIGDECPKCHASNVDVIDIKEFNNEGEGKKR